MQLLKVSKPEEDFVTVNEALEFKFSGQRTYVVRNRRFVLKGTPEGESDESDEEKEEDK